MGTKLLQNSYKTVFSWRLNEINCIFWNFTKCVCYHNVSPHHHPVYYIYSINVCLNKVYTVKILLIRIRLTDLKFLNIFLWGTTYEFGASLWCIHIRFTPKKLFSRNKLTCHKLPFNTIKHIVKHPTNLENSLMLFFDDKISHWRRIRVNTFCFIYWSKAYK